MEPTSEIHLFDDYSITGIDDGDEVVAFVRNQYPCGISEHGNTYIFNPLAGNMIENSVLIDNVFELVRQLHFPESISRFQSLFAVSKEDIPRLAQVLGINNEPLFEVECEHSEPHDMMFLIGSNYAYCSYYAHKYWSGEESSNPLIEYLLKPPVNAIRKINYEIQTSWIWQYLGEEDIQL